ncbi:MAG TPA: class I SAM-dependent methyltransferase [Thermodesulfobacteriota bacterium]|nr:class I SAM-dependent methyltransferase [Thermodesulfobacteriota bacterium]
MGKIVDWGKLSQKGYLASGIDPGDRKGHKNYYIDLLQKMALKEVLEFKGDELVLDFGCGSGRIAYWIAPRVKKVVGVEITPEMINLAESNRTERNVEFVLYDSVHFPIFPFPFDFIISVGVLQTVKRELLKNTLSSLAQYLKKDGMFCFIEQVSDSPKRGRPGLKEYLDAFGSSGMECLQHYPIRKGRWWLLYLIRYGLIPQKWFSKIAVWEMNKNRKKEDKILYYKDFLFLLKKP